MGGTTVDRCHKARATNHFRLMMRAANGLEDLGDALYLCRDEVYAIVVLFYFSLVHNILKLAIACVLKKGCCGVWCRFVALLDLC